jgi:uncharacterized membrane protein
MLGLIFCLLIIIRADFSHIAPEQQFVVDRGRVLTIHLENIWPDAYIPTLQVGAQVVDIEVLSGPFSGEVVQVEHELSRFENLHLREGQDVLVSYFPHEEELTVYNTSVHGPSRGPVLFIAMGLLLVGMLVVGRAKGFYAIISLSFTFVVIIFLLIHGIVTGGNPIFLALATSLLIISFTTGMISGATKEAISAILGALVGLLAAGLTSVLLGRFSHISGIHLESVRHVLYHTPPETFIRIPDLFFAVVIIATTGAMIDSTISLASTVSELKLQSPKMTCFKLYESSMQVGRSVLGANVNTLILAFAGTSLVTVLLIVLFGFSHLRIFNLELVAIEIIQGVAAVVSILTAIPATALFASYLATKDERGK